MFIILILKLYIFLNFLSTKHSYSGAQHDNVDSKADNKILKELTQLQSNIDEALAQKDKFNEIQARLSEWFIKYGDN